MSDAPLSHHEYEELVAALALDALEADEHARAREHLESCPSCRALFADLSAVAGKLADTLVPEEPPDGLRARILAGARHELPGVEEPSGAGSGPAPGSGAPVIALRHRPRARRLLLAAAVVALVAGGTVGGLLATAGTGGPPASCRAANGCAQVTLTDAITHRPAATVIVSGATVWLRPATLAPNDAHADIYVLWELAPHRKPLAVGGFDVRAGRSAAVALGSLPLPYARAHAFAISLERGRVVPPSPSQPIASGTIAAT